MDVEASAQSVSKVSSGTQSGTQFFARAPAAAESDGPSSQSMTRAPAQELRSDCTRGQSLLPGITAICADIRATIRE